MDRIIDGLGSVLGNPILNGVGLMLTIALAVFLYFRGKRQKEPCWTIRTTNIVRNHKAILGGVSITYEGTTVETLSISRIAFWNAGSETLRDADIASANPLHIEGHEGTSILDCKLLDDNAPSSRFRVAAPGDHKASTITFEYLDKNQGGVVQVIHTGGSSADLEVMGDIKGAKLKRVRTQNVPDIIPRTLAAKFSNMPKLGRQARRLLQTLFFAGYAGFSIVVYIVALNNPQKAQDVTEDVVGGVLMGILVIMMVWMAFVPWRNRVPRGLEMFEEDIVA